MVSAQAVIVGERPGPYCCVSLLAALTGFQQHRDSNRACSGSQSDRDGLAARFVALWSLPCAPLVRDTTGQVQHAAEVVLQSTGQADTPPADRTVSVLQRPDDMGGDRLATHEAVHGESAVFAFVFMTRFGILWRIAEG